MEGKKEERRQKPSAREEELKRELMTLTFSKHIVLSL